MDTETTMEPTKKEIPTNTNRRRKENKPTEMETTTNNRNPTTTNRIHDNKRRRRTNNIRTARTGSDDDTRTNRIIWANDKRNRQEPLRQDGNTNENNILGDTNTRKDRKNHNDQHDTELYTSSIRNNTRNILPDNTRNDMDNNTPDNTTQLQEIPEEDPRETRMKIKKLLEKHKGLLRTKKIVRPHKEPVLLFITKDYNIEYYDGVKGEKFEYQTPDNKTISYDLQNKKLLTFQYGNDTFKGYIQYEEEHEQYPRTPLINARNIETSVDKILTDMSKWKIEEQRLKLGKVWAWAAIIGIIAVAAYLIVPYFTTQTAGTTVQTITENITTLPGIGWKAKNYENG